MQQDKIEILCTGQLDELPVHSAAQNGLYIECVPFITIHEVQDSKAGNEIVSLSQQTRTVVFTSPNAVKALINNLQNRKTDWKIYCLGGATQNLISGSFGENAIQATAHSSAELARMICDEYVSGEIIFFSGNIRRDELPNLLKKNHIPVKELTVYETVLQPRRLDKNYDGILFFSPSEVKSFFSLNQPGPDTVLFAIGETTQAEIKKISGNSIIICPTPGKLALVDKAIEFFLSRSNPNYRSQFTKHE